MWVLAKEVQSVGQEIDTSFDVRTDAGDRDPDLTSATLRRYHRMLWSKRLPSGAMFVLDDTYPGAYLHHRSHLGEFFLSSDTVMPTFVNRPSSKPILGHLTTGDDKATRFFTPFEDFTTSAVPADIDTYREFRRRSIEFIDCRNLRITRFCGGDQSSSAW